VTLTILAQERGLVAIDKPAGLLVLPGRNEDDRRCARDLLAAQLGCEIWPCHRIDRDTSGVVLFATDPKVNRTVSMAWNEKQVVKKRYAALVKGRVTGPMDIDLPITEGKKGRMAIAAEGEDGKPSRTLIEVREAYERGSLVGCEPLTGRQHQIRVHLKAMGHPLLFDHQYGRKHPLLAKDLGGTGDDVVLSRTPLHAEFLSVSVVKFEVSAPLPADMVTALELLRSTAAGRLARV
jgi:tRNA pseudouridine32 synthase/23S rRNA pseudouridine746 synthase/23S rRNA pseudouridine955/2504/2580 synthase